VSDEEDLLKQWASAIPQGYRPHHRRSDNDAKGAIINHSPSRTTKPLKLCNGTLVMAQNLAASEICVVRMTKPPPEPPSRPYKRQARRKPDEMLLDEYLATWQKDFRERLAERCRLSPDLSPEAKAKARRRR